MIHLFLACCLVCGGEKGGTMQGPEVSTVVAKERGLASPAVRVVALPGIPGATLYRVTVSGEDDSFYTGAVLVAGTLHTDLAGARTAVAKAWGYGAVRTVPPLSVAQAMVVLMDSEGEPKLIADAARAEYTRRLGVAGVDVPLEGATDGLPSVTFWYGTGANPAQEMILLFHPDFSVEFRNGRAHSGG